MLTVIAPTVTTPHQTSPVFSVQVAGVISAARVTVTV